MANKIKPEFVPIYPVADSLDSAWEYMASQLPINSVNDLKGLLMQYHNSCVIAVEERIRNETDSSSRQ